MLVRRRPNATPYSLECRGRLAARPGVCSGRRMRAALLLFTALALAAMAGCAHFDGVVLAGPSVHDQLDSRGYITTRSDTTAPVDTLGKSLDSLGVH